MSMINSPHSNFIALDNIKQKLVNMFGDLSDDLSLMNQHNMIQRHPSERISHFNLRFEKTWKQILSYVRPSPYQSFSNIFKSSFVILYLFIGSLGQAYVDPGQYHTTIQYSQVASTNITPIASRTSHINNLRILRCVQCHLTTQNENMCFTTNFACYSY